MAYFCKPVRNEGRFAIKIFKTQNNPITYVTILTIKDLVEEDYGEYECKGSANSKPETTRFRLVEKKIKSNKN